MTFYLEGKEREASRDERKNVGRRNDTNGNPPTPLLYLHLLSPLVQFLHIAPKDLWPNADMFLKQIRPPKKKEVSRKEEL